MEFKRGDKVKVILGVSWSNPTGEKETLSREKKYTIDKIVYEAHNKSTEIYSDPRIILEEIPGKLFNPAAFEKAEDPEEYDYLDVTAESLNKKTEIMDMTFNEKLSHILKLCHDHNEEGNKHILYQFEDKDFVLLDDMVNELKRRGFSLSWDKYKLMRISW